MEPTSLIHLPDGTVLDPASVAAILPPDDEGSTYVYYRLLGIGPALAFEAETPEHAAEVRAYMVACKELATPARDPLPKPSASAAPDEPGWWWVEAAPEITDGDGEPVYGKRTPVFVHDGPGRLVFAYDDYSDGWEVVQVDVDDLRVTWAGRCLDGSPSEVRPAIFSAREAIAETNLPPNMSSADAIRELWARLTRAPTKPGDWLDPQSRRVIEHREAQGPDGIAAFCAEADAIEPEPLVGALGLIAAERAKQVDKWGSRHDDGHEHGELAVRGAELAVAHTAEQLTTDLHARDAWGLVEKHKHDRVRCLTIAGALIAAELDRVLRYQVYA